ncbi:MAG: hypothetical protein U0Q03_11415 [Acidimicrobiales bacterium]
MGGDHESNPSASMESIDPSRRQFIRKMVGVAFVAPVVSSFGMASMASAGRDRGPRHTVPNQTYPNQTVPQPKPEPCDDGPRRPRKRR